jgi:hypothetical protein
MRTRGLRVLIALVVLAASGTVLAATGAASSVFGDGDGATAQSGQERVGGYSAPTPRQEVQGQSEDGIVLGAQGKGQAAQGGAGGGGGGGGRLPFTGLMAIPVIALGVGLLGAGLVLRRRTTRAIA